MSVLFAALLGYNPVQTLLGSAIAKLPASHAAYLTGRSFFPALISPSFSNGLHIAFDFAIVACLIAAIASLLRGRRYVHEEHGDQAAPGTAADPGTAPDPGTAAEDAEADAVGTAAPASINGQAVARR